MEPGSARLHPNARRHAVWMLNFRFAGRRTGTHIHLLTPLSEVPGPNLSAPLDVCVPGTSDKVLALCVNVLSRRAVADSWGLPRCRCARARQPKPVRTTSLPRCYDDAIARG